MHIKCGAYNIDLTAPTVMGVLNVTSDSFSDGGRFVEPEKAITQALKMQAEGADIIDIGGESTRPEAKGISADEELQRVIPIIEALSSELDVPISIDSSKPEVMSMACKAGASMINDVQALNSEASLKTAVDLDVPVCIMHMQGTPRTMQNEPEYRDVVTDIMSFFETRTERLVNSGLKPENIIIDPGFGFGKTLDHNLQLLRNLSEFGKLGFPLLIGLSKKSMIGTMLGLPDPDSRLIGTVVVNTIAAQNGANILRVHDVLPNKQALTIVEYLEK